MTLLQFSPPPPSFGTDAHRYLQSVVNVLNRLPPLSNFSLTTPESVVTATRGSFGINANSAASVFWVKATGSGNTGWQPLA